VTRIIDHLSIDSEIFVDSSVGDPVFFKGFNKENVNNYDATVGELLGERNETHLRAGVTT
jgi:hypothetical protein